MGRSHKFSPNYHRIAILKEKTSKHHIITNLKCHWLDHSVLGLNFTIFKKTKTTKKKQPSFEEFQKPSCNCPSEVKYFSVNSLTIGWQASLLLWIKQNLFGGQLSRGKKKKDRSHHKTSSRKPKLCSIPQLQGWGNGFQAPHPTWAPCRNMPKQHSLGSLYPN